MITYAIDFGTSNSLLAAVKDGEICPPIPLDPEARDATVLRSVLFFPDQDTCHYGQRAIDEYIHMDGDGRLLRSMKKYLPSLSYRGTYVEDRVLKIEDMIGVFLLEMKRRADTHFGEEVTRVVLGRPARFSMKDEEEKMAVYRLQKAAEFAGFKDIEFLPEPLAAAFDIRSQLTEEKTVLVVDLGGGTSDFTVIRIGPKAYEDKDLLALGGVSVAGDVIDGQFMKQEISPFFGSQVEYVVPMGSNLQKMPPVLKSALASPADIVQLENRDIFQFFKDVEQWVTREQDKTALHRLMVLVEDQLGFRIYEEIDRCKRSLGDIQKETFRFDYPEIEIQTDVEREQFREDVDQGVQSILDCMNDTLQQAGLKPEDIDLVHCTGGTSKLFAIRDELNQIFDPQKLKTTNAFHSVIQGLAQRAKDLYF